jgi:hypothetical protein
MKSDRAALGSSRTPITPRSKTRFRLRKLEERIAPTKGGKGTNNCTYTDNCGGGHLSSGIY